MALEAAISLDTSGFEAGISKVKSLSDGLSKGRLFAGLDAQFSAMQSKFTGVFSNLKSGNILGALVGAEGMGVALGGVAVGAAAVAVAATGMWSAMGRSKELNIMAESAQVTVPQLMVLEKAFTRVGGSIENVPLLMSHLNQFLQEAQDPASKAAQALQSVGMSVQDFEGQSFYEIIKKIAGGMDKATDSATRFALASSLGGIKKAAITAAALNPAAIAKAEANVSPAAKIYEEQGSQFREFQGNVGKLSVSMDSFFAGMASKVIPEFIDASREIERMEPTIVNAGVQFGESIAGAVRLLKDGFSFISENAPIFKLLNMLGPGAGADMATTFGKSIMGGPLAEISNLVSMYKQSQGGFAGGGSVGSLGAEDKNTYSGGMAKAMAAPSLIASSFTKMGAGGEAWGAPVDALNIQREQLAVQQRMANALEQQLKNERQTGMGYALGTEPLMGD